VVVGPRCVDRVSVALACRRVRAQAASAGACSVWDAVGAGDRDHLVGVEHVALDQRVGHGLDRRLVLAHERLRAVGLLADEPAHGRVDLGLERRAGLPVRARRVRADQPDLFAHAEVGDHAAGRRSSPGRGRRLPRT
jgi:hypothetical protein